MRDAVNRLDSTMSQKVRKIEPHNDYSGPSVKGE